MQVIINTNYAKFELKEEKGMIYERHSGYGKGCFLMNGNKQCIIA